VLIAAAAAVVLASGIGVTYFVVVAAKKSPVTATLPPASPDPKPPSLRASAVSAPSASASAPSIEASGAAMPPDVPNAKYYVALVARNGTSRPQADIERVLLGAFRDAFIASGVVQLAVPGLSDDAERALIKSCGLRAFTVLVFAEPFVSSSGGLTFKLKSTVIAEPDHALKGELSKSATMADAKPGDVANEDALFTTTAASVAEALLKTFFPPPPPAAPARAAPKKCTCAPGDPLCSCL
jgi:hypothetical protein